MGRKRIWVMALLLVACMIAAACGKDNQSQDGTKPSPSGGNAASATPAKSEAPKSTVKLDKPATITMMTLAPEYKEDLSVYKWIQDATNITVKGTLPAGTYNDAVALALAGGDIPDIIFINGTDIANKYGQQGALLDFNTVIDKMPNLKKFWEKNPDAKRRATSPEGKTYMAINDGLGYSNQQIWMYRDDIFQKMNLKAPATWDELYTALKTLKAAYPDSYPLTFRGGLAAIDFQMSPSFKTFQDMYQDLDTGEVKYGQVTSQYKKMIEYLNKFNKEKLMTPDWLSTTVDQWNEMMVTGKSFVTLDYIGRLQLLQDGMKDTSAALKQMAPPAGPGGAAYNPNYNYMIGGFTVYKNAKNQDAALHYIDFLYSDEGKSLVSWGKEGETYKMENGKKVITVGASLADIKKKSGIGTFGSYGILDSAAPISLIPDKYKGDYDIVSKYAYPQIVVPPSFTQTEVEVLSTTFAQIKKTKDMNIAKFILGDRPLAEWDAYVGEINKLGLQKVIDIYKAGWDRQKK
ncbi:MAG: extracellular solute-binding protein [Paenibacillaceae bacterium]|nr:extracellular solute-binding protein [Paenibacillaceae bacterium]